MGDLQVDGTFADVEHIAKGNDRESDQRPETAPYKAPMYAAACRPSADEIFLVRNLSVSATKVLTNPSPAKPKDGSAVAPMRSESAGYTCARSSPGTGQVQHHERTRKALSATIATSTINDFPPPPLSALSPDHRSKS